MRHHPTKSPSSFPAFLCCPCYKSSGGGRAAVKGTLQHEILSAILLDKDIPNNGTKGKGLDDVLWAAKQVKLIIQQEAHNEYNIPLEIEKEISVYDRAFEEITFGSLDVGFKDIIIDYKSGMKRNYFPQMACYALGWMQKYNLKTVKVVEVYGKSRDVIVYNVSRQEAEDTVYAISDSIDDPNKTPQGNEYCSWCSKKPYCAESNVS